jgi:hypothetical protein
MVRLQLRHFMKTLATAAGMLVLLFLLTNCAQQPLLADLPTDGITITPNGDGSNDAASITYAIGAPAHVSIWIEGADGQRWMLRDNVRRAASPDPYLLSFDGTVHSSDPNDPIRQSVLPNGTYSYVVQATPDDGSPVEEQRGTIEVRDAITQLPMVEDVNVTSNFSPNEDAIDDVAYFTYRLPITSTVTINLTGSEGQVIPFISDLEEGPYAQSHLWDGKQPNGALVASGAYTYTITARDRVGNVVERRGPITIESQGRSEARVTFVHIAPVEVALSDIITVTVRVKNTGNVPIRTQGPGSGFLYSTDDTYASILEHRWKDKGGGFWRVGLDWGGGHAYPFRWALSERPMEQWAQPNEWDYLQPNEEVDITGSVRIEQRESRMEFYVGLVHEGVGYPVNNVGRTLVCVGIPGVETRCKPSGSS